jgi:hypothetical protein
MKKSAAGMGIMGGSMNSLFKRPEKSWRPAAILLLFEVFPCHFSPLFCCCPRCSKLHAHLDAAVGGTWRPPTVERPPC